MAVTSQYAEEQSERCMQGTQEQCLRDKAEQIPSVRLMYGWELLSFYCDGTQVYSKIKRVQDPSKEEHVNEIRYIKSQYIVGCDGPNSTVTNIIGAKFDGFVNLGQTKSIRFIAPGLTEKVRPVLGESFK
jgi:2-polyprenyl-6-methoxyphenol hydroxylase-like FAD-dependent oxidoreductase